MLLGREIDMGDFHRMKSLVADKISKLNAIDASNALKMAPIIE